MGLFSLQCCSIWPFNKANQTDSFSSSQKCMPRFMSCTVCFNNPATIWDWFTFMPVFLFFLNTDLDGREISRPCPGVSTLKPWKMLRWKMKMAKIYPWLLLLFVRRKVSMNYWNFGTQSIQIQLGHFRLSYVFISVCCLTSVWGG